MAPKLPTTAALVDLAQRSLRTGDLPTEGGERPQVVVTTSYTVPTAIRRAVLVRDSGCAKPSPTHSARS